MYFEFPAQLRQGATWSPTIDVRERAHEIVIVVEMPGVHRSDVQLAWNDGLLIISGTKRKMPPAWITRTSCPFTRSASTRANIISA